VDLPETAPDAYRGNEAISSSLRCAWSRILITRDQLASKEVGFLDLEALPSGWDETSKLSQGRNPTSASAVLTQARFSYGLVLRSLP